MQGFKRK